MMLMRKRCWVTGTAGYSIELTKMPFSWNIRDARRISIHSGTISGMIAVAG